MANDKNIYKVLFPIFFVCKIVGFSCISLKQKSYSSSFYGYIYPLCFLILFGISAIVEMYSKHKVDNDMIYSIIDTLLTFETIINTLVISIFDIVHTRKMIKWLRDVDTFDKEISNLNINIEISEEFFLTTTFSIFGSTITLSSALYILVVDVLCFFPTDFVKLCSNICYCIPILATNLMFLKFSALLFVLRRRFKWINQCLLIWKHRFTDDRNIEINSIESFAKKFQAVYLNEKQAALLDALRMKHYRIHTLSEKLNNIFAFPVLFAFLQIFLVFQVYSLYFIKLPSTQFAQKTTQLYQYFGKGIIVISVLQLLIISLAGSMASSEAHATGTILNGVQSIPDEMDEYVKYFLSQLFHNKVEITAGNIFVIRAALIFQVASSIMSYLVLCIQLHI